MKKYQDILKFSQYLVPEAAIETWHGGEESNGVTQIPFVVYNIKVDEFLEAFASSDCIVRNYSDRMNEAGWYDEKKLRKDIAHMSDTDVLTCLTAIIAHDRLNEGLFGAFVKDGTIAALLERLNELAE